MPFFEWHYADCCYEECRFVGCHCAECYRAGYHHAVNVVNVNMVSVVAPCKQHWYNVCLNVTRSTKSQNVDEQNYI